MNLQEESLRNQIAVGWLAALALQAHMLGFMTVESILADNNFRALRHDPGLDGLKMLVYPIAIYALMPVFVHLVHGMKLRAVRWLGVALAAFGFLFYLLHHIAHWYYGQRPDLSSHVFDLAHHLISIWILVNSIRWARFAAPAASAGGRP